MDEQEHAKPARGHCHSTAVLHLASFSHRLVALSHANWARRESCNFCVANSTWRVGTSTIADTGIIHRPLPRSSGSTEPTRAGA